MRMFPSAPYSAYLLIALTVALAGYIAWRLLRRRRRRGVPAGKQPNASQTQEQSQTRS
jgi:hypothetical protein